ncbi:MAG: biotin--[acetyl-CoA-carboxylase] ligase [Candidatus Eisenbacteria bacterium]|nr:biotin--[acetyl-CoA-carboxylase] ligase [Candidatus Eisenbacteria bacterium]
MLTVVGRRVVRVASVGSTNTELRALADAGEPEGTVLVADEQTAGRGRAGRPWFSPAGRGLWFSFLLRPNRPAAEVAGLSVATALSVASALRGAPGVDARVKWPNDIVVGGRKLGGVLLESRQAAGGAVESVIVGVGINVNVAPDEFPAEIALSATSLSTLLGRRVSRQETLRSLLERLDADARLFAESGLTAFRARWLELSATLGRPVEAATAARTVRGTAVDLSPDGALVVETDDGRRTEVRHGDVRVPGGPDG